MNYFLLNRLNLRTLLLLLHRIIFKYPKSTFLSPVKCWWPLSGVKFLHVFDCYFLTHLLLFVVYKWIFVIIRIKSQCQNFMWRRVGVVALCSSTFLNWKWFSFKSTFPFRLVFFQTFLFFLTSATHDPSGPSFIEIFGTGVLFDGILILDLNFKDGCLFLEAVQVNIVHVKRIFALKHFIHVFLNSGPNEGFV